MVTCCELIHSYSISLQAHGDDYDSQQINESVIDKEAIVRMANDKYFSRFMRDSPADKISVYKLSCLYWIYINMGDAAWD